MICRDDNELIVNYGDLLNYDPNLAKLILKNPINYIDLISKAAYIKLLNIDFDYANKIKYILIKFINIPTNMNVSEIKPLYIGNLISITGKIIEISKIYPLILKSSHICIKCKEPYIKKQIAQFLQEPDTCLICDCTQFVLDYTNSVFIDSRNLTITDNLSNSNHNIRGIIKGNIAKRLKINQRIKIIGILEIINESKPISKQFTYFINANNAAIGK